MRCRFFLAKSLAVLVVLAFHAPVPASEPISDALPEEWLGEWTLVTYHKGGENVLKSDYRGPERKVKVVPRVIQVNVPSSNPVTYSCTVDTSRNPHAIDLKILSPFTRQGMRFGIIAVDGDTMTICHGIDEKTPRPTSFDKQPSKDTVLIVCKRTTRPRR